MQYVPIPAILDYTFNRPSAENLAKLEIAAFSALAAIHNHDVCHNDIHCGNILWQLGGDNVWLVDFGSGVWPRPVP
jgi:thiamine kinase-like enzyme